MVIVYIFLVLLVLVFVCGCALLYYTCGRKKMDDMWDKELVEKHHYGKLWDSISSGKAWLDRQTLEELSVTSFDGKRLNGFLVRCENARGTILLFHGWRSSWKLDFTPIVEYFNALGLNIIMVDERAQCSSQGLFITFGVKERRDVYTWVEKAVELFGKEYPLFLHGVSMGAATVLMASDQSFPGNVRGIMADSAFISPYEIMDSIASKMGRFFPKKAALWLLNIFTTLYAGFGLKEYDTLRALSKTRYPIFMLHGTGDKFVPCEMSKRNFEACQSEKELLLVEGAGHALSYFAEPERVKAALVNFLEKNI